jgi:A/G-specific adenine glycosylase
MPSSSIGTRSWRELATALCAWYRRHARDLPFRRTRDPYAIWISEVMLQQTRVGAVTLHYAEFLRRFPDLRSLAEAELGDVLAAWAGLGYYQRARQLHAAARRIHFDHAQWPRDAASLRLLPGFGAYTAGAVASIAFGQAVPAVDGNVERVLARRLGLAQSPKRADGRRRILAAAQELLAGSDPAELNQALMELGALVCTPKAPRCSACPWSGSCAGEALGAERFPQRAARPSSVDVACYAAVTRRGGRYLLRRLPEGVHNAGLWELPTTPWHEGAPDSDRAQERLHALAESMATRWTIGPPLLRIRHSITRHRIRCVAYEVTSTEQPTGSSRWVDALQARSMGLSAASHKILERLESPARVPQFQLFAEP